MPLEALTLTGPELELSCDELIPVVVAADAPPAPPPLDEHAAIALIVTAVDKATKGRLFTASSYPYR